jgi:CheY-like chemotaxis protein
LENIQEKRDEKKLTIGLPQKLNVLIADDEIYNRKLLVAIFKKYNAVCVEAENGIEAIKEVKKNNIDVNLIDRRMKRI